jgi:cold shock CspA family protein
MAVAFSLAASLVAIPTTPALAATATYVDEFSAGYSGSSGSLPWATDWIEWGEADGASAGALVVGIEPNCPGGGADPCLIIGKGGPAEVALEREVDLSVATTATLEFSVDRHVHAIGTHGTVELSVSGNGGTDWTPLETWDLSVEPGVEVQSYDLAGHLGPNTRIRFRQYGGGSDSHINIDNLVITAGNDLSVYAGGIVINEVLFDGTPADDEEFVEVFNATGGTVSLAGWQFTNRADELFYTFPPGTSLGPGEYAVVWMGTVDPGGLRDVSSAAFQDGANRITNFFWDNGDAIWLHDDVGLRVDFVAWGTGSPSPPPEWDATHQGSFGGNATARGQSISLTPNGVDGNDSACWEPTTSGDAAGRCAGYIATADGPPVAQLWTPGFSNQGPPPNSAPAFLQDLPDRADAEGTLVSVSAGATDSDPTDTLAYTASGLPEGISLDPGTGLLTGALSPNAAGTHAVTITVTDDGIPNKQDVDTFTWTVTAGEVAYLVANWGGGNGGDDQLTAVDLSDPNPASNEINIGTGTGTSNIESIALQPGTDTLFAVENNQLGTIDLTTGVFTALPSIVGSGNGPAGLITFDNIESFTFNPYTGHLYGTHWRGNYNEDLLFRIDPATGAIIPGVFGGNDYTPIQQEGPLYHVADLAFDPTDGQLYGIHWTLLGSFALATIDPATGATTSIGAVPTNVTGLAFSDTGRLWGTTADTFSPYFLYEFDKTNASVLSTTVIDNAANYESIAISFPFNPNQPPVFDQDLLDRVDPEGTAISVSAGATDPDIGDALTYTATGLPSGLTINPGNGLITGTITFTADGTYSTKITTIDNGIPNLADADTFTWTITEVNRAPVFDQDLLDRSDAEGTPISLSAAATDPDLGNTLTYTATGLPAGLTIDPGSGLITGTLTFTASGTYPITITVSDDGIPGLTDTDSFIWTVADTNRPPVIVNPGAQTTPELAPFTLSITASDPDLTIPGFSDGGTLPAWATLTDNLDGTATISGTPGGGDSATTTVTISADDGLLSDDAVFDLTVTNTNLAPVMVNPGDQSGAENTPFTLTVSATDPDTTIPNFTATGVPGWATLTDNADGTATITGTPGYDDAAITTVTVTASDGSLTDDATFNITISNTNRLPIVDPIPDASVAEADPLTPVTVTASDPDLTIPRLTAAGLPAWATLTDNLDGTATITGTPGYTDASTHLITITADDGTLSATATFTLTITNTNRAPAVAPIADQSVAEADPFLLVVSASDPDLTVPFLNVIGLPGWASFSDNLDGTATISGTPGYTDANTHLITITATDDDPLSATETFDLTVTNTNLPPVIVSPGNQVGAENSPFSLTVSATDPDATIPALTATGLPAWAALTDNGDGTATITGTPGYDDAAITTVTVTASDGSLTDDEAFTLTVTNTNRPPVVDPIADQTVAEADPFGPLTVTASDLDLTIPSLSATGLPAWATFTDNLDGTATLIGAPGYTDANIHAITVTADDGALTGQTAFTLTVTNTNRAPTIANPGPQTLPEATLFSLTLSAGDLDGTIVTFTDDGTLPAWATLLDNGDNTALIAGTPTFADAATTTATVTVSDGLLTADAVFDITVTNTNRPPVVDPIADQTVAENVAFTLSVSGSDPDLTNPALTATGLPAWATFTDNGDGTATITGTPGYEDDGTTVVTVTVSDGTATASASFTLTVTNTNRAPVIDPIPDATVAEADPLAPVPVSAIDEDGDPLTLTAAGMPAWAILTDDGDGIGTLTGTPGYEDDGTTVVTVTVSDGTATASASFTLTVTGTNRAPEAVDDVLLVPADAASSLFSVVLNDTDPDGDTVSLVSFDAVGIGAGTLTDEGAGVFRYVPGPGAPYAETFTYTIEDTAGETSTATVFVSVSAVAALPPTPEVPPALIGLPPLSGVELEPITFTAAATVEADVIFRLVGAPAGATIDPATGTFAWTPSEAQGPGVFSFVVRITDADGMVFDEAAIELTIGESDTAPTLLPMGALAAEPGSSFTTELRAFDPDLPAQAPRFELVDPVPAGAEIDPRSGRLSWDLGADEPIGLREITIRVRDESDPSLFDDMTIVVTIGAASSSDRKATLIAELIPPAGSSREATPVERDDGIQRTLVIMARAGMGSARSFGTPFLLLLVLTLVVLSIGRISLHPLLGRSRRMKGTVAWFDEVSGYGFIIPDTARRELFLHRSALTRSRTSVMPGDRVSFRIVKGEQRSFALGVREVER